MHTCFTPYIVFGIVDIDDKELADEFLDKWGVHKFVTEVVRGYACQFIYGKIVSAEDVRKGKKSQSVLKFAKELRDKHGIDLGEPEYLCALSGDYESSQHEVYNPDDDAEIDKEYQSEEEVDSDLSE